VKSVTRVRQFMANPTAPIAGRRRQRYST